MLGRHVFMDSLVNHGVSRLFGNPGTTESPLLDSLADYPGITYTTALHEGVALGAATFYAQASGGTGVVNLHVAPGLGNAIGMLYCALKAKTPLIVTAGQQDTRMRLRAPVLSHDLVAMATPVTRWAVQAESADELADIMHRAFRIAHEPPGGPVFIALPINVMEQETRRSALEPGKLYRDPLPNPQGIAEAAALVASAHTPVIIAGDDVARMNASGPLMALAQACGAPVWSEGIRGLASVPGSHPHAAGQLPVDSAAINRSLHGSDLILLVGGPFFEEVWYAEGSPFPNGTKVVHLERTAATLAANYPVSVGIAGDLKRSVEDLLSAVHKQRDEQSVQRAATRSAALSESAAEQAMKHASRVARAHIRRPMAMPVVTDILAGTLPDDVIVVDETITASTDLARSFKFDDPAAYFSGRGGGIGQGLPGALGVQLAHPERTVACISGDGSAMYSIQSFWTAAHHGLPIVFVILANGEYRILKHNLDGYRQRFATGSNKAYSHMDLSDPGLGFVEMAAGMGVSGCRVSEPDALKTALEEAIAARAPRLIEVAIEGKR
jgi:benzoylformate decarboxylase